MSYGGEQPSFTLPTPGRALKGVMLALFGVWLAFALGLNWGGVPSETFLLFVGDSTKIWQGEVWRLFTAPLMHPPSVGGILYVLIGLFFLTPALEEQWGSKRLLRFLAVASLFAYLFQMALELVLPTSAAAKLVGGQWYGAAPAIFAVSIAYALTFRGRTIRLFFVLPVTSRGLIFFVFGIAILYVITLESPSSGLIAPFGGMAAGYLFGGGTPSPARKLWLRLKLQRLEQEARRDRVVRKDRVKRSGLRVIEGGDKDSDNGKGGGGPRGPDGNLLN